MRIKDVLTFAYSELVKYSNYNPTSNTFFNVDSTGLQDITKLKGWLATIISNIDDETTLSRHYQTLVSDLKRIVARSTRDISFLQAKETISAKAESPLAHNMNLTIQLIEDKFRVAELHQQSELAIALCNQIQLEEDELKLKMQKQEEEYRSKELALLDREKECQLSVEKATSDAQRSLAVLAKIFSAIPSEWQQKFQSDIRELNISTFPNGTMDIAVTFAAPIASSSQLSASCSPEPLRAIKPKYLPDNQLMLNEHMLTHTPYEGAKLVFSYAMSPLHALAAAYLYRYFLRLNDFLPSLKSSSHQTEYREENHLNKEKNLDIGGYIMAAIFYLFMETEKNREKIQEEIESGEISVSPLAAIAKLAKDNNLTRLVRKIDKISQLPLDISDKVPAPDSGKTPLSSIGKYAGMFFNSSNLSARHASYCHQLYSNKIQQHDNDTLKSLYQPG
ncbi:hypothetical protein [Legionella qingyii]|uniref:hypothetical protein n=1 Tax=Legionella qingyii TaxID=2184757 RepID=UPI000F8E8C22|nr:hypothetical protein [Legionella qingyii]RUR28495.1 hypothetical protein ELY16_03250 [Legionella qingyii]